MHISVVEPVSLAIERTRKVLFQPFTLEKWLGLGFCAFLANLGSGGYSSSFQTRGGGGGGGGGGGFNGEEFFRKAMETVREYFIPIVAGTVCLVVAGVLFGMLLTWLSSRGQFMFLDGVARNRGAVSEPWHEFRREAQSLFWFRFWFGLAVLLIMLTVLTASALVALPDIQARQFGLMAIVAIVLCVSLVLVVSLVAGAISIFLSHFVVPIMYVRRCSVQDAWSEFGRVMFADYKGTLVLYLLFQIVLGIAIGILAVIATCCTCCIVAIPYIGTVILLPLFVFMRAYSLYFVEQFGPEWRIFQPEPADYSAPLDGSPFAT